MRSAASIPSPPVERNIARLSGSGRVASSRSASASTGSESIHELRCTTSRHAASIAATTRGWLCPTVAQICPAVKSRTRCPSTVSTNDPDARCTTPLMNSPPYRIRRSARSSTCCSLPPGSGCHSGESAPMEVRTVDYHTAGEPFRIVVATSGRSQARCARAARDRGRRPDGSTVSVGCCVTSRAGTPTCTAASSSRPTTTAPTWACCSGTRTATRRRAATARSRSAPGRCSQVGWPRRPTARRRHDRRAVRPRHGAVRMRAGEVRSVAFRNVPVFVMARGVVVAGDRGRRRLGWGDLCVRAGGELWAARDAEDLPELIAPDGRSSASSTVRRSRGTRTTTGCPASTAPSLTEHVGPRTSATWRSLPTAKSTARRPGRRPRRVPRCCWRWRRSAIGDFWRNGLDRRARVSRQPVGNVAEGLLTEVCGTAFRTGEHRFLLDPRDPLGTGFVLR